MSERDTMVIKKLLLYVATFGVLAASSPALARERNLIESITVEKNKVSVRPHSGFKKQYLQDDFFALYEPDINLEAFDYSIVTMPFLMNVVSIIWISGDTYYIDEMDSELHHSLARIKNVFKIMYPGTSWNGELIPRKLIEHKSRKTDTARTALLFSGGIDSTSTALAHLDKKQLLITAWGHWDLPLNEKGLWQIRKNKIDAFAHSFGNETATIKSNYSSFLNWEYLSKLTPEIKKWRLGAVEGLGWAGLTAPLLLAKGYQILRIPSSHTWNYPYPAAANPCVDNNLLFCGLQVMHDQFDMTRLSKISFISKQCKESKIEKPFLKICSYEKKQDANCGNCRKCISSATGFYVIGDDPQKYGIKLSLGDAVEKTVELLKPEKLNYYTILYFKEVQAMLRARHDQHEKIDRQLLKLLSIDLDTKVAFDTDDQQKLDWPSLLSCLPTQCWDKTCPTWILNQCKNINPQELS